MDWQIMHITVAFGGGKAVHAALQVSFEAQLLLHGHLPISAFVAGKP